MNRSAYQYARHNFSDLRRVARIEGRFRGLSPAMDLFLSTFTRREREALTADSARAEANTLRAAASPTLGYGGGRAYAVAQQVARDCAYRALMLDKLAAELEARK